MDLLHGPTSPLTRLSLALPLCAGGAVPVSQTLNFPGLGTHGRPESPATQDTEHKQCPQLNLNLDGGARHLCSFYSEVEQFLSKPRK